MTDNMKASMRQYTVGPTNDYQDQRGIQTDSQESRSKSPTSIFQSSVRSVTPPAPVQRASPSPEEPPVLLLPRRSLSPTRIISDDKDVPSFDDENEKTCSCQ